METTQNAQFIPQCNPALVRLAHAILFLNMYAQFGYGNEAVQKIPYEIRQLINKLWVRFKQKLSLAPVQQQKIAQTTLGATALFLLSKDRYCPDDHIYKQTMLQMACNLRVILAEFCRLEGVDPNQYLPYTYSQLTINGKSLQYLPDEALDSPLEF